MDPATTAHVGVMGVGHFGAALVRGLLHAGMAPHEILLSPRGSEVPSLVAEFGVVVAADSRDLVARSDVVFLSVRPPQAAEAIRSLPWHKGQLLISVCAGVPIRELAAAAADGPDIVRAMPMTSVAIGASPTVVFPEHARAVALLKRLGSVIPLHDEGQFEIATALAVAYTLCHDLVGRTAEWATRSGLDQKTALRLSAAHFESAARVMAMTGSVPHETLIKALVTKGGVAEAAYGPLRTGRYGEVWEDTLAAALARVRALSPRS
jgi:pyrroline-5-carboxylate reductase